MSSLIKQEKRRYEELTLSNNFIFFAVMQNEELCKEMLETILDVEIEKIEYLAVEKPIKVVYDGKGIRLDVYVKDDKKTVYNLEMQVADTDNIPKRTRYYQSMIDRGLLMSGDIYESLNESIIIFICRFDLFGQGKVKYTFKNMCKEVLGLELGDGTTKLFVNSTAIVDESKRKGLQISEKLENVLKYIETDKITDKFTQKLDDEVKKIKKDSEWREGYMLYELTILAAKKVAREEGREEGIEEGIAIGEERGQELMGQLCNILVSKGRVEEIAKVTTDLEYRETLYKEYELK